VRNKRPSAFGLATSRGELSTTPPGARTSTNVGDSSTNRSYSRRPDHRPFDGPAKKLGGADDTRRHAVRADRRPPRLPCPPQTSENAASARRPDVGTAEARTGTRWGYPAGAGPRLAARSAARGRTWPRASWTNGQSEGVCSPAPLRLRCVVRPRRRWTRTRQGSSREDWKDRQGLTLPLRPQTAGYVTCCRSGQPARPACRFFASVGVVGVGAAVVEDASAKCFGGRPLGGGRPRNALVG
jgi:hypothetical protein